MVQPPTSKVISLQIRLPYFSPDLRVSVSCVELVGIYNDINLFELHRRAQPFFSVQHNSGRNTLFLAERSEEPYFTAEVIL